MGRIGGSPIKLIRYFDQYIENGVREVMLYVIKGVKGEEDVDINDAEYQIVK